MSIEELDNALMNALDLENKSLFVQGDIIISGIEAGLLRKQVYGRFAYLSRRGIRTAKQRHKVSAIFSEDKRNPALNWSFHSMCANAADLRDESTWDKAYQWLERAAGLIADGREYSTEDLRNDMLATGLDPDKDKPTYYADKDVAIITGVNLMTDEITLKFGELTPLLNIPVEWGGFEVIVTIVKSVQELHLESEK